MSTQLKIYKSQGYTHLVVIGRDVYEMDSNSSPNGVNVYVGDIDDISSGALSEEDLLFEGTTGMVLNILYRVPNACLPSRYQYPK